MGVCRHCGADITLFDKAPSAICDGPQGWATDESGDPVEDFICPARETTGRYPDGKPHEPRQQLHRYVIETEQRFTVTYVAEAASERAAWDLLLDGQAECASQIPGPIVGELRDATIKETTDAQA